MQGKQIQRHEFTFGRSEIDYELRREDRTTLAITVHPDKTVLVRAPIGSPLEAIEEKLAKRGRWILKQINFFDQFHPLQPPRQYVSGETHTYLGRQYRLRNRRGHKETVRLSGKFFLVTTRQPDNPDHIRLLMQEWYASHAQALLDRRIRDFAAEILGEGFQEIKIEYAVMKTRWGVCLADGRLRFNYELIKTPLECIEYVIIHELCHLVHPNHDRLFYLLMQKLIPNWKERKARLERFFV